MRLLVITQKVDAADDVLGFFHGWLRELAGCVEKITVVTLGKGKVSLPSNVTVFSLGKDENVSRATYIFRFFRLIVQKRKEYDTVFVHMNPEYLVLGGWLFRLWGKRIGLWYNHREVHWKLRVGVFFAHHVFTASREGFRLATKKLSLLRHGIDVSLFAPVAESTPLGPTTILHIGRITPIKNCDVLVRAAHRLTRIWGTDFRVIFVGEPGPSDAQYAKTIHALVVELGLQDQVLFRGKVANVNLPEELRQCHMTVNLAPRGGMDKAVLESFAAGRPAFVSNTAFEELFGEWASRLIFRERDHEDLARKIAAFLGAPDKEFIVEDIGQRVRDGYSVKTLMKTIVTILS